METTQYQRQLLMMATMMETTLSEHQLRMMEVTLPQHQLPMIFVARLGPRLVQHYFGAVHQFESIVPAFPLRRGSSGAFFHLGRQRCFDLFLVIIVLARRSVVVFERGIGPTLLHADSGLDNELEVELEVKRSDESSGDGTVQTPSGDPVLFRPQLPCLYPLKVYAPFNC